MKVFVLAAAISACAASPVSAQQLWQNINAGMTADQVRALYPDADRRSDSTIVRDFQVSAECEATVDIMHEAGTVTEVRLRGGASLGGRCADTILAALSSRYGQPASESEVDGSLFRRPSHLYVWNRDGITLRFKRMPEGGLAQRSWELVYTTIADDVAI